MPRVAKENITETKNKGIKPYISSVGRRREAIARVRLYATNAKVEIDGQEAKKGDIIVNSKPISEYFRYKAFAPVYNKFLLDTGISGKYILTVKTTGGGLEGQLGAMILGIARALDKMDKETFHAMLRQKGYLTRDPRTRERRKVGNAGKARRKKSSPKR
jgi:small subunit ribosomal protein S9